MQIRTWALAVVALLAVGGGGVGGVLVMRHLSEEPKTPTPSALPIADRPTQSLPAETSTAAPTGTARCGTDASGTTLTEIKTGRHDTFDRIVLVFDGPAPACVAQYVDQIVSDGSGEPIPMSGAAFLQVGLQGAAAHDDAGQQTYTADDAIDTSDLTNVTEVVLAGDFEGLITVGVGLNRRTRYEIFALSEPTRIAIDIDH